MMNYKNILCFLFISLLMGCVVENGIQLNEKIITFKIEGASDLGCNASVDSVTYDLKFYVDGEEQESFSETIKETDTFDHDFSKEGTDFKLALRLVDFDKDNPEVDLGEVLENLNVTISNLTETISLKKSLENLFVCTDTTYGVDILFNSKTKKLSIEYYKEDTPVKDKIAFVLEGASNLGCNTSIGGVTYDVKFIVDGKEKEALSESINEIDVFKNEFLEEGVDFKLALRLVDYNKDMPEVDLGEILEKLNVTIKSTSGSIDKKEVLSDLFVCTDITYGVDVLFNADTKEFSTKYYKDSDPVQNKISFALEGSSNLGCNTSIGSVNYELKFTVDGVTQIPLLETVNEIEAFSHDFSEVGTDFKLEIRLVDFDIDNASKDIGEILEKLKINIKDSEGTIEVKKTIENLFVCTDVTYGVDILFNADTKEFSLAYYKNTDPVPTDGDVSFVLDGASNLTCDTSIGSVTYNLKLFADDVVVVSEEKEVNETDTFSNELKATGENFKLAIRLVDFDKNNSTKDIGEVLENLKLGISNFDKTIDIKKDLDRLFICTDFVYGADVLFNKTTKKISVEYYSETNIEEDNKITFTLEGKGDVIDCLDNSAEKITYSLKFEIDGVQKESLEKEVNDSETFTHNFKGEGGSFRLALRLVNFDENNTSVDIGEQLSKMNLKITDSKGTINIDKPLSSLFICADIAYGLDVYFDKATKKVTTKNFLESFNFDELNVTGEVGFFATSASSDCSEKTAKELPIEIKYFLNGNEVKKNTLTLDNSSNSSLQANEFTYSEVGEKYKIQVTLTDYNKINKLSGTGQLLTGFNFAFKNYKGETIFTQDSFESLSICGEGSGSALYQITYSYDAIDKKGSVEYLHGEYLTDTRLKAEVGFHMSYGGSTCSEYDASITSVPMEIKYFSNNIEVSNEKLNVVDDETVSNDFIFPVSTVEYKVEVTLTDYDKNNPLAGSGEYLSKLNFKIKTAKGDIVLEQAGELLFICSSNGGKAVYKATFVYNSDTKEKFVNYTKDEYPDVTNELIAGVNFRATANSSTCNAPAQINKDFMVGVKYFVNGDEVSSSDLNISPDANYLGKNNSYTFPNNTEEYKVQVTLNEYYVNDKLSGSGRALEGFNFDFRDGAGNVVFEQDGFERVFICGDGDGSALYQITYTYNAKTKTGDVQYLYDEYPSVNTSVLTAEMNFNAKPNSSSCTEEAIMADFMVGVKYFVNGDEVSASNLNISTSESISYEKNSFEFQNNTEVYTVQVTLNEYNKNDKLSGSGRLLEGFNFDFRDAVGNLVFTQDGFERVFICGDGDGSALYQITYTYNAKTKTGDVQYLYDEY